MRSCVIVILDRSDRREVRHSIRRQKIVSNAESKVAMSSKVSSILDMIFFYTKKKIRVELQSRWRWSLFLFLVRSIIWITSWSRVRWFNISPPHLRRHSNLDPIKPVPLKRGKHVSTCMPFTYNRLNNNNNKQTARLLTAENSNSLIDDLLSFFFKESGPIMAS